MRWIKGLWRQCWRKRNHQVVCGNHARDGLITVTSEPIIPKTNFQLKVVGVGQGMLCSPGELNISNESDGIIELKNKEREMEKVFKNKAEKAIDISITPNRADCLGIRE